jgi:acyl carrier protein
LLDASEVRPEATLADLGIDSLGLVETVFAIEEAFDVQVPFNANEPSRSGFDISSVDAIVRAVEKLIAAKD